LFLKATKKAIEKINEPQTPEIAVKEFARGLSSKPKSDEIQQDQAIQQQDQAIQQQSEENAIQPYQEMPQQSEENAMQPYKENAMQPYQENAIQPYQ